MAKKKAKKSGLAVALDTDIPGATPIEQPAESEEQEQQEQPLLKGFGEPSPDPLEIAEKASAEVQIALSAEPRVAYTLTLGKGEFVKKVKAVIADENVTKTFHDYKAALRRIGCDIAGAEHDIMLYSYLINPAYTSHSLNEIALRHLNMKLAGSLAEAADITSRLSPMLRKEVEEGGLLEVYHTIDLPLSPVLARMEDAGVRIDLEALAQMSTELEKQCDAKARQIHSVSGQEFNINSPKQLGDILFNKMGLPKPVKYGKGKTISTAVDVLEELAIEHEIARFVLDYRQLSKLKSTYVDALPSLVDPKTGRLHTTFNQAGTATGRLSSTNPNLQNIPIRTELGREIRAAFIADAGNVLLSADYSQIELRLMAHFSEDPLLVEAFRRGDDIHQLTASEVFGVPPMLINDEHRRRAKAVNFGIVYGISPFGLAAQLDIEQKEAKTFIEAYFAKYKGVRAWLDSVLEQARKDSKVSTLFGRTRPIPDINSKNANMRGFAERTAVNTPLQGTAADLIKMAMIRIDAELRRRKLKSRMTLQVHDELVFEVPEKEISEMRELVGELMQNVYLLKVPLMVNVCVGSNWRDVD